MLLRLGFALSQSQQPWVRRWGRQYVHPHARTHIHTFLVSTLMRTLRVAQGTKSAYVICLFSLASCRCVFLLIFPLQCHSRARCVHHQHLLLRLQRLPRPQRESGQDRPVHPHVTGGSQVLWLTSHQTQVMSPTLARSSPIPSATWTSCTIRPRSSNTRFARSK